MSGVEGSLTQEQLLQIQQMIADARADFIESAQAAAVEAIKTNQQATLDTLKENINEAIRSHQRMVVATVGDAASDGASKKESKLFKTLLVVLPVVLTTALGFWIWKVQNNIQVRVDENSEKLKSQLNVTEEFYKKKLKVYEDAYEQMANLMEAFNNARVDPDSVRKANESLGALYKGYTTKSLYMSNAATKELKELWKLGVNAPFLRQGGETRMSDMWAQVAKVETEMKNDLHVDEVGQLGPVLKRDNP